MTECLGDNPQLLNKGFIRTSIAGALDGIAKEVIAESVSSEDIEELSNDDEDNHDCCSEEESELVSCTS